MPQQVSSTQQEDPSLNIMLTNPYFIIFFIKSILNKGVLGKKNTTYVFFKLNGICKWIF